MKPPTKRPGQGPTHSRAPDRGASPGGRSGPAPSAGFKSAGPRSAPRKPGGYKPDGARPDGARPDGARPEGGKSAAYRSDGYKPNTARPGGMRQAAAKPDAAKAASGKPASAKPANAKPEISRVPYRPPPETRAPGPATLVARPARPAAETSVFDDPQPRRDRASAEAPGGTVWLYGIHAIAAALANPNRRLRRLLLTEEAEAALAERLPQPWPLARERSERPRMDQLLGRDTVHQGAALLADPLAPPALAQAMERPGPVLVLDQVSDPRNIGAILRSAAAFGAAMVIAQDRHTPQETGALAKAASGALETMPLLRAVNLARTLVALKAAGCWVVGLDAGSAPPLSGPALAGRRVALVLGAEGSGLRRLTRDTCDEVASLAMPGVMESLNVAAAASVALYELRRET